MAVSNQVPWFTLSGFGPLGLSLDPAHYGQAPDSVSPEVLAQTPPSVDRRLHAGTGDGPGSFAERIFRLSGDVLSAAPSKVSDRPSTPAGSSRYALNVMGGKRAGETFSLLEDAAYKIGYSPNADVTLPDAMVSSEHAEIALSGGDIWIKDLGSHNGTFVNGTRIKGRKKLQVGDRVVIGTSVLVIALPAADKVEPPAATSSFDRMSGTFGGDISLADVLQLYQQMNTNGVIVIRGEQKVKLHLSRGSVVFAEMEEAPQLTPFKVFFRLFMWNKGTYEKLPSEKREFVNPLTYPPGFLIMEAVRQLDEFKQIESQLPKIGDVLTAPNQKVSENLVPGDVDLTPHEWEVFHLVDLHGNLRGVIDHATCSDLEASRALLSLIAKGLVNVVSS